MIITSECEQCRHGIINDENRARIKVICTFKNKEYYYGQCIPCDNKIKITGDIVDGSKNKETE